MRGVVSIRWSNGDSTRLTTRNCEIGGGGPTTPAAPRIISVSGGEGGKQAGVVGNHTGHAKPRKRANTRRVVHRPSVKVPARRPHSVNQSGSHDAPVGHDGVDSTSSQGTTGTTGQHTRTLDLSRFQAVLVGSPIRAQGYLRPVVRFVQAHRTELARLPALFFSVGLAVLSKIGDGRAQTMRIVEKLVAETGWHPRRIELVAGALPYTRYNVLVRFVMRRISKKEGGDTETLRDYEYTDWGAVDRFAANLVEEVVQPFD